MYIPDIFNNILPYLQNLYGGAQGGRPTYTPSGSIYNGPFKNDTRTPFRTVTGIGQYGQGLNSSAAQMYEHFSGGMNSQGRTYRDVGLKPVDPKTQIQSYEDFLNRGKPKMPADTNPPPYGGGPVPPPKFPTVGFGGNFNGFLGNLNGPGIFNFTPEQLAMMQQR